MKSYSDMRNLINHLLLAVIFAAAINIPVIATDWDVVKTPLKWTESGIDIILKDELVLDHLMPHIHIIHSEVVQRKKSKPVTNMLVNFKRFIFAP